MAWQLPVPPYLLPPLPAAPYLLQDKSQLPMPGNVLQVQPQLLRRSVEAANSALRAAAARGEDRRARLLAKATQAIKAERKSSHAVLLQFDPPSPSLLFFFFVLSHSLSLSLSPCLCLSLHPSLLSIMNARR